MEFYINGDKIEAGLENEKTVGEVLQSFAVEFENNKAAVIGIKLDGNQINAEQFDEEAKKLLTDDMKFEFEIVTEPAIKDSFSILSENLKTLAEDVEQVPSMFINGKAVDANETIKRLADVIDQFCHLAALASLFPQTFANTRIGEKSLTEFFDDFSPLLTDFENALESDDTVLVGDLCEYEICPRLRDMAQSIGNL